MRIGGLVQVRLGSERLPGKALEPICAAITGKPVAWQREAFGTGAELPATFSPSPFFGTASATSTRRSPKQRIYACLT